MSDARAVLKLFSERHPQVSITEYEEGFLWFFINPAHEFEVQLEPDSSLDVFEYVVETDEHHLQALARSDAEAVAILEKLLRLTDDVSLENVSGSFVTVIDGEFDAVWEVARSTMQEHGVELDPATKHSVVISSRTRFELQGWRGEIGLWGEAISTGRVVISVETDAPWVTTRDTMEAILSNQMNAGHPHRPIRYP